MSDEGGREFFSQVCFGGPRHLRPFRMFCTLFTFAFIVFHNEVGGGKLLGVVGAGQTNASASRFAVSGAPG